tara:strand:- start:106 stop:972 length:867 start_codon:yes stop_codon:yes gene_type:complete
MIKKIKLKTVIIILIAFSSTSIISQNNLLDEINYKKEDYKDGLSAFKAHKIINGQSTKQSGKNELYLYVAHRFGSINDGIETLFGLDIANTKIEVLYGISDEFQAGFSRESLKKIYTLNLKYKITKQRSKFPLNSSLYASYNYNSSLDEQIYPSLINSDRNLFLGQLLLSSRINDKFSIQLSPTYAKKAFTETIFEEENNVIIGLSSSYRLTNRLAFNVEYFANLSRPEISQYRDVLSFGIDIETGGHVFQLIFSNTQSSDDISVHTDAEGSWKDGEIYFGFNILRVF